jgi:hypothetical protein
MQKKCLKKLFFRNKYKTNSDFVGHIFLPSFLSTFKCCQIIEIEHLRVSEKFNCYQNNLTSLFAILNLYGSSFKFNLFFVWFPEQSRKRKNQQTINNSFFIFSILMIPCVLSLLLSLLIILISQDFVTTIFFEENKRFNFTVDFNIVFYSSLISVEKTSES